jgi:DNA-binding transcriptional ArsR family regulator
MFGQGKESLKFEQPCPIRDVLDRISDQWSMLVLGALEDDTLRFSELMRRIGDISKQMLSQTLKRLEQDGFVRKNTRRLLDLLRALVGIAPGPFGAAKTARLHKERRLDSSHHKQL